MGENFVKLYGSILDSSIWSEPSHVRLVWITMLAMADENGYVGASVGGLARRAVVSREDAQDALTALLGPDPDSRDGTAGERIQRVSRGWQILNHRAYRDMRTEGQRLKAERQARWRAGKASSVDDVDSTRRPEAEAEAEAEADSQKKKGGKRPARAKRGPSKADATKDRPVGISPEAWTRWIEHQWEKKKPTTGALTQHRTKFAALASSKGSEAAEGLIDQCIGANAQGLPGWAYEQAMNGQAGRNGHRSSETVSEKLMRECREQGIEFDS